MTLAILLLIAIGFASLDLLGGWLLHKWYDRQGDPLHAKAEDGKRTRTRT